MARVTVVGSLNMDLVVRAPRWPSAGETLVGEGFATYPGGKGLNQAAAARRAGAQVAMVGRLGADAFGHALRDVLGRERIDASFVREDAHAGTGIAIIQVDQAGQNRIVVVPLANGAVEPADIEAARAAIADAEVLLLQGEVGLPASRRAAEIARAAGRVVVFNPAPAPQPGPEVAALLQLADYVLPNETELRALSGAEGEPGARALCRRTRGCVLATLGPEGALLLAGPEQPAQRFPSHPVEVTDTVGAGDAFAGAFSAALAGGATRERAAAMGNAAGALACTRPGALPSMPRRAEILALAGRDPTESV